MVYRTRYNYKNEMGISTSLLGENMKKSELRKIIREIYLDSNSKIPEFMKMRVGNPDVSKKIQQKAFRLGYTWSKGSKKIQHIDEPFLLFSTSNGNVMSYTKDRQTFNNWNARGVTSYLDFMRLKR